MSVDRAALAARQSALLAALAGDTPAPAGFDARRLGVQAAALARRRAALTAGPSQPPAAAAAAAGHRRWRRGWRDR